MSQNAGVSVQRTRVDGIEVIRLLDPAKHMEVSIVPSVGNIAYEFKIGGRNALWFPFHSLADFKAKPALCGVPFLAPWANRLDGDAFWANGKRYHLNPDLDNVRRDANNLPIHGLLSFVPDWQVVRAEVVDGVPQVTSRLEFWKHPEWMAQFPFAHTIEMTYLLRDGALEVRTAIENHALESMPVAIGFHPYFQLTAAPRDSWQVHLPVSEHFELSGKLVPTGATSPMKLPDPVPLAGNQLDDVFGGVRHDDDFRVSGGGQQIAVHYGEKYPIAVVYAPPGRDFICFEPMTGVTNAFNLAHEGRYRSLQTVPAGGRWEETFSIHPTGF